MSFDINSFVIDRALRGTMFTKNTFNYLWSVNQIKDPALKMTADSTDAVDAIGVPIMTFERAKQCEFTASNALFDLGLLAAQSGTNKKIAAAGATIKVSCCEELTWVNGEDTTLAHVPVGTNGAEVSYVYKLNGDGTIGKKYEVAASAASDKFAVAAATKKITPPTNVTTSENILVFYDYTADGGTDNGAVSVNATAKDFPTAGRFFLEVLGCDTCNISTKYYAYLDFPQAKLTSEFDLTLGTDMSHPFTIKCMQDYCDHDKKLFTLTIPEQ